MTANMNRVPNVGEVAELMRRAFAASADPTALNPHYDSTSGKYDNIGDWMALHDDGLVYGVRIPKYSYSPVTTAIKTDANAGKVLEASTDTSAGQNDYLGIGLFLCPRVHGGVDKTDMMPFVTSMEEYDDRFNAASYNTYIARPVYYKKVTDEGNYILKQYSFKPRTGFKACRGAYTPSGQLRPFILTACYPDSGGDFSSKSGQAPAANYSASVANMAAHCANNDFSWSKSRASTDGLTYLDYGDIEWLQDFMELMLGVKAPRSKAVGCVSYDFQYTVAQAETGVKRVILTDAQAANVEIGSSLSIGDGSTSTTDRYQAVLHNLAKSAKVVSKTALGSGKTAINLDLASNIDVPATGTVKSMPWRNGSCDGVLGTFGAPTAAGLTNGKFPFKFQNTEWELGLYEVIHNMHSVCTVSEGVNTHEWYIAPDCSDCSGVNESTGWTKLTQTTVAATTNAWNAIKDYTSEKGARVPQNVGGTTSQGFMTSWHPGSSSGQRETPVGGTLDAGAAAGVGCVSSSGTLTRAGWNIGGRSSAIGHSAPAE